MTPAPDDSGPFDIIGDVHGCIDELTALLLKLGYTVESHGREFGVTPPEGRRVIFLGDLVNRGPDVPGVLRLVMGMAASGAAFCVPGNHDVMLMQALRGEETEMPDAVETSLRQLDAGPHAFKQTVVDFVSGLPPHRILVHDHLVVAHAGLLQQYQGSDSEAARRFASFGSQTEDAAGKTVRYDWARDYRGARTVVYGHTPQTSLIWINDTICVDTGCVYGGALTALRYPERELVSVKAAHVYWESSRTPQLVTAWSDAAYA